MASYALSVNGKQQTFETDDPEKPLLYALRDAGLTGTKFGCGLGQCGACTVLVNGQASRSCQIPLSATAGMAIVTIEGVGTVEKPSPLQASFIRESVPQCGYCTSGMIMSATGLLNRVPKPSESQVRDELEGNLCRCGSHDRVVRAVLRAGSNGG